MFVKLTSDFGRNRPFCRTGFLPAPQRAAKPDAVTCRYLTQPLKTACRLRAKLFLSVFIRVHPWLLFFDAIHATDDRVGRRSEVTARFRRKNDHADGNSGQTTAVGSARQQPSQNQLAADERR